jgi:hypothetical protein
MIFTLLRKLAEYLPSPASALFFTTALPLPLPFSSSFASLLNSSTYVSQISH